jgi:hypothetical protein
MLESVFICLLAMAFLLFLLGIVEERIVFTGTSLLLWIVIFASCHYIQVPADTAYVELGLNAASIAFIVINIIWMILMIMQNYVRKPGTTGMP